MIAASDDAARLGSSAARREVRAALRQAARLAGGVIDLLLPPQCPTCDAIVDRPGRLCPDCFRATSFITEPCCRHCGVPFAHAALGAPDGCCPTCRADLPLFDRARAAFRYDDQARRVLLPFKHGDRVDLARALAPAMARAGAALLRDAEILVPVPLHRSRLFARRYNQAALLARAVGRIAGRPVAVDALRRLRRTESLGHLTAAQRAAEVADAFAVAPRRLALVAGRRVLLFDDVLTSGATTGACAAALRTAGARAVDVLVAARVADPRLDSPTAAPRVDEEEDP